MEASGAVQSVDRVLDIVERLSENPQGLSLSDVASATRLHISTAHRLLKSLASRGYVHKDGHSGKYRLTLRLFEIGGRVSGTLDLLNAARMGLDALADASQEAVHLVARDGDTVVYLYKAEPFRQSVRMDSCVGKKNPLHCTGVGKIILAFLPEAEVVEIWQRTEIVAHTPHTCTNLNELQEELHQFKAQGFALDREEHELGVCCVAVPILDWTGAPIAALSISAPTARLQEADIQRVLPQMRRLSQEVSGLLGRQI